LFALPSNQEQFQLAQQLDQHDIVLVQGPPGTGKTHTIANLIGHLLANKQRILITSHSAKALRVLRDKVPTCHS
jgi:Tfp pilus assembly pilus retraction ATPase PilT